MADVMKDPRMPGFKTRYYKNLFYVLTGERFDTVTQERWQTVWQSLAFYIFIQSTRLSHPLMRPNKKEWRDRIVPLRTVLARLQPDFVLIAGVDLLGHVSR